MTRGRIEYPYLLRRYDTTDILVEKQGRDTKVACIGPAGENMVFCAAIANDKFHYLARCAVGAVMGSKRLKAIAINGTLDLKLADPAEGQTVELDKMLPRYYEVRGWQEDGRPTEEKLAELGISV